MVTVTISEDLPTLLEPLLLGAANAVLLHQQQPPDIELAVVLSDDQTLQALNLQYMGINAPTDVLSFPADEFDPETDQIYLGDVIISYERAFTQALAAGHPVDEELQLLVVHGVLHLLGYDHAEADEKAHMWSAQAEILHQLGITLSPD